MSISTKKLGLAAYIKMQGGCLVECVPDQKLFIFDSDKSVTEWEVEYLNSCCHKHDSTLINLRGLLQN